MTTRVLITGIAGFIGSHVAEVFSKRKYDVFGIDDLSSGKMDNLQQAQNVVQDVVIGSVVNPVDVYGSFARFKPDIVIHLAAQPSLLTSIKHPEYDAAVNILGTINILNACKLHDVKKLIFSSTSAVTRANVVEESSSSLNLLPPDNPYGLSKRCAELYIQQMIDKRSIILRFANVYGPRQVPLGENQLIPRLIRHLMFEDEFEIYGDGTQTRDYIYVKDVADAIIKIIESNRTPKWDLMNIGTGKNHSVLAVADTVMDVHGTRIDIKHGDKRDNRQNVRMVVEKANTLYGWKAKTSLKTGIEKTWNWWKNESKSTHSGEGDTRD